MTNSNTNQPPLEISEEAKECINKMSAHFAYNNWTCEMWEQAVQEAINQARAADRERIKELEAALNKITCMYCKFTIERERKDELVDHILTCEKSPLVQLVKDQTSFNAQLETQNAELRRVLEQCRDALKNCYNVCDFPADGSTPQDEALAAAQRELE